MNLEFSVWELLPTNADYHLLYLVKLAKKIDKIKLFINLKTIVCQH